MPKFHSESLHAWTVEDFLSTSEEDVVWGLKGDRDALRNAYNEVLRRYAPVQTPASSLLDDVESRVRFLPTGCAAIDRLLYGGVREGQLTEIYGETASGKTQLCLSLAAYCAARGERVLYIDTSNAFAISRLLGMLRSIPSGQKGMVRMCTALQPLVGMAIDELSPNSIVFLIVYFFVFFCHPPIRYDSRFPIAFNKCITQKDLDALELISVAKAYTIFEAFAILDRLASDAEISDEEKQNFQDTRTAIDSGTNDMQPTSSCQRNVFKSRCRGPHLVVVDSIGAIISPILGGAGGHHSHGHALLSCMGTLLKQVAKTVHCAVVVTNHTVGSYSNTSASGDKRSNILSNDANASDLFDARRAALGESWSHQAHVRLQLCAPKAREMAHRAIMRRSTLGASNAAAEFWLDQLGVVSEVRDRDEPTHSIVVQNAVNDHHR